MDLLAGEKRKNDETRRRIPLWLLLLAVFALGVIVTLLLRPAETSTVYVYSDDPMILTATAIIQEATALAGGVFFEENPAQATLAAQSAEESDSLYATATAIIQGATATAQAGS